MSYACRNWLWIIVAVITTLIAMCAHMSGECLEITKHGYLQSVSNAWDYHLHIDRVNKLLSYPERWTIHFTDYSFWTACAFLQVSIISFLLILEPEEKSEPTKLPTVIAMLEGFAGLVAAIVAGVELFRLHQIVSQVILILLLLGDCVLYSSARMRLQSVQNDAGAGGQIDALHARTKRMIMIIWGIDIPIIISFLLINCYVYVHHSYEIRTYPEAEVVAAEVFYYGATALQLFLANFAIIALSIVAEYETYCQVDERLKSKGKGKMSIGKFIKWQFLFAKPSPVT